MRVIATAGHVDHGKSTLVSTLTGMDPDRLSEEKARGMTIDLGFAWGKLASGTEYAFVDVPGHVRFLKNMLAGVGAVDACLFVVAATEGWKPQSEEHLHIVDLLGVRYGTIALTKAALVDADTLDTVRNEIELRIAGSFLEGADIVGVDCIAGVGIEALEASMDKMLTNTPPAIDVGRPRLWIDRSFAMRGAGAVVTGTLTGGSIAVGDELAVAPVTTSQRQLKVRVRGLQSRREPVQVAHPGQRVAVNLVGASHAQLTRGQSLIQHEQWVTTKIVDGSLSVLASLDHGVTRRGAFSAYFGSGEYPVTIRILGTGTIEPGETGAIRMYLPTELPLTMGDRFVLRESGRSESVGGGAVFDVQPILTASRATPDQSVDRIIRERGWVDVQLLDRLTGVKNAPTIGNKWVVDPQALAKETLLLHTSIDESGSSGLEVARLSEHERVIVDSFDDVVIEGGRVHLETARPSLEGTHPYLRALEQSPFVPPQPKEFGVSSIDLATMLRSGTVVKRDDCYFSAGAVKQAANTVARLLSSHPDGITVSLVREELGSTRKYVVPLLELLDSTGVTRRRGDVRIGGPRLPPPES